MSTFRQPEYILMQSLLKTGVSAEVDSDVIIDMGDYLLGDLKGINLASAYGSFIHGSEDEFREIRIAAIRKFF